MAAAPENIDTLTATSARQLLLDDQHMAREWFNRTFSRLIREISADIASANNAHRRFASGADVSNHASVVIAFTHTALHALITSAQLLISGYPVPSGHMMRQYAECSVMALMCAVTETGVFERYDRDPQKFPVHKSLEMLSRKEIRKAVEASIGFSHEEYLKFVRAMRFFDKLSHASALVIGHSIVFSKAGGLVLGSHIDTSKRKEYRKTLTHYGPAARVYERMVQTIAPLLSHV